jgi:hypothetical protein
MKNILLQEQMELTLAGGNSPRSRRKAAPRRAGWWFGQMRRVVDQAIDRKPRPAARAHQVYFTLDRMSPNW